MHYKKRKLYNYISSTFARTLSVAQPINQEYLEKLLGDNERVFIYDLQRLSFETSYLSSQITRLSPLR